MKKSPLKLKSLLKEHKMTSADFNKLFDTIRMIEDTAGDAMEALQYYEEQDNLAYLDRAIKKSNAITAMSKVLSTSFSKQKREHNK